jgi:hypothetical protein
MLTLTLIAFLVAREMVSARRDAHAIRWVRVLNVGVLPLAISFLFVAAVKVLSAL